MACEADKQTNTQCYQQTSQPSRKQLINQFGWHADATKCVSPNQNARPDEDDISLLVIHSISLPPGQFGSHFIKQLFLNQLDWNAHPYFKLIEGLRVSAHVLIDRHGKLTQFVPFYQRAWHAGSSAFEGRIACNDFSIGIELEGTEDVAFEDAQYRALARLTSALIAHFPMLNAERIVGHSDIAPGRKTDPGPYFEWERFRRYLKGIQNTP